MIRAISGSCHVVVVVVIDVAVEERSRGGEEERRRGGEEESRRGGEERRRGGEEEKRRGGKEDSSWSQLYSKCKVRPTRKLMFRFPVINLKP